MIPMAATAQAQRKEQGEAAATLGGVAILRYRLMRLHLRLEAAEAATKCTATQAGAREACRTADLQEARAVGRRALLARVAAARMAAAEAA